MDGARREMLKIATQAAWRAVRALEKPGAQYPTTQELEDACAAARLLTSVCDYLRVPDDPPSWMDHPPYPFSLPE